MNPVFGQFSQTIPPASGWMVVIALGTLVTLLVGLVTLARLLSGKSSERQIEPTQLAAMGQQIGGIGEKLSAINRELGEVRAIGERTETAVSALTEKQHEDMSGVHRRIDGISERVAALEVTK